MNIQLSLKLFIPILNSEYFASSYLRTKFTVAYPGYQFCKNKTAFTRYRNILKTVKNVTVAKFELAFIRYRHNLKTVGNLTVKTRCRTLMLRKSTYTLRIVQSRSKSV